MAMDDRHTLTMAHYDRLSLVDREAINAWIRTNQLDGVTRVRCVEPTGHRVRITRYLRNDNGDRYLAAKGTPADTTETIIVAVPFPLHVLDFVHP